MYGDRLTVALMLDAPLRWLLDPLSDGLGSVLRVSVEVGDLPLDPSRFVDESRGQVRARELLERASGAVPVNPLRRVVMVVEKDGYVEGFNFVFGVARPGWGGLVFTARLRPGFYGQPDNPLLFAVRVLKEVLHELGHSLGLGHCMDRRCVMSFSNSVWEVDRKNPAFCRRCALELERMYPGLTAP